ncbi:hypothetical protein BG015_007252 [Linnemannia schmuckeri]|uniref:Uncharacterized protein n=1 Tax=Linnemannia schmuckeri TaxID=64567 RepID=A0A9P5S0Z4_9FUNG|nr:hypothetical protein BG015_007252 [Linnemannia schmuckeri]
MSDQQPGCKIGRYTIKCSTHGAHRCRRSTTNAASSLFKSPEEAVAATANKPIDSKQTTDITGKAAN